MDRLKELVPSLVTSGLTLLIVMLGGAFGYGRLRQEVNDMKDRIDKLELDNKELLCSIQNTLLEQGKVQTEMMVKIAKIDGHLEGYKEGKNQKRL